MKRDIQSIIKEMKKDAKFKRLRTAFDTLPMYQLPIETLITEIESSHKIRKIRRLNPEDPKFVDALIQANVNDQATRSRMTEIMMTCIRASTTLEAALEALSNHLLITYSEQLRGFRTKEERKKVIDIALSSFTKYVSKVITLRDLAQFVVNDIDKGNWSLRLTVDALKIDRAKESYL